jgi:hypothetical protein
MASIIYGISPGRMGCTTDRLNLLNRLLYHFQIVRSFQSAHRALLKSTATAWIAPQSPPRLTLAAAPGHPQAGRHLKNPPAIASTCPPAPSASAQPTRVAHECAAAAPAPRASAAHTSDSAALARCCRARLALPSTQQQYAPAAATGCAGARGYDASPPGTARSSAP